MKEVEEIVWYLYIKNWKIMWSDKTWKNKSFWTPIKITLPWYYRMVDWVPKLIVSEKELKPWDTFVWNRDWKQYREKRQEATWWEKPEDTRTHDELKNDEINDQSNSEDENEQSNDEEQG